MERRDERLGTVTLEPHTPIVAGTVGEWTLRLTVGSYGIDEGGTIKLARRFASDWARPQFDDPAAPDYCTVRTNGAAKLRARYDPKAHVRPWMKCIVIDVYDGTLAPGDLVEIVLGDQSGGSPGLRAQSFIESAHELRVLVDPTNACLVRRLPSSPVLPIIPGPPQSLSVVTPTDGVVGEVARVFVKGEDRWGNPTPAPVGVTFAWESDEAEAVVDGAASELSFRSPGRGRVLARWNDVVAAGNPCRIHASAPDLRRYWGDLHAQSDATVGTGTEREYFAFGRDWAALDVMCHQGNDFQMTDEDWTRLNAVVREFHRDGEFVVFPGFEWSANTTAGGDRNVMYLEEDLPILRSSHWQIPEVPEDDRTPAHPADVLFEKLREHVPLDKVVLAAHCGGRYADIRQYFDEELGPLVEVCSCWGVFEWLLWDAFEQGYRVGVISNSDGHKGRPGAEGPGAGQFGILGGLTCMLSETLTRADVFRALKQRRCYGTTGPRMDLSFTIDGHPMGAEIVRDGDEVTVSASVVGCGPIESLLIYEGRRVVHEVRPPEFSTLDHSRRVRLTWGGARIRGRGRRAIWDGTIEVTGIEIERAEPHAFDSPADGIREQTASMVRFDSRTTGDIDGIDLWLADVPGPGVTITLKTGVGTLSTTFAELAAGGVASAQFGGLDLHARIERFPEAPTTSSLELVARLNPARGAPVFVKAVQVDGHMAWSSPIYVD
jgi:hypothetical protein